MTADPLFDEVAALLDSPREARWLLEELDGVQGAARRHLALELAERRRDGEPLQYVIGHWPFRGLDLLVDSRALIPRPETEPVVDYALAALRAAAAPLTACDLGCGTGAIALCIAVEAASAGLDVTVHATDLSAAALQLAAANAARVGARGVVLSQGSWYAALDHALRGTVNVVCANPPYVSAAERATLARELDFEPESALVARDSTDGTAGFADLEAVIGGARDWLAPHGTLLVEHGSSQGAAVRACAEGAGLEVVADHDDLAGLSRVLEARRPS